MRLETERCLRNRIGVVDGTGNGKRERNSVMFILEEIEGHENTEKEKPKRLQTYTKTDSCEG